MYWITGVRDLAVDPSSGHSTDQKRCRIMPQRTLARAGVLAGTALAATVGLFGLAQAQAAPHTSTTATCTAAPMAMKPSIAMGMNMSTMNMPKTPIGMAHAHKQMHMHD